MNRLAIKPAIAPMVTPIPVPTPITKIEPSDLNFDREQVFDKPFEDTRKPWDIVQDRELIKFPDWEQQQQQPKSNKLLLVAGVALLLLSLK